MSDHRYEFAFCRYCRREWQLVEWGCALHRHVCDFVDRPGAQVESLAWGFDVERIDAQVLEASVENLQALKCCPISARKSPYRWHRIDRRDGPQIGVSGEASPRQDGGPSMHPYTRQKPANSRWAGALFEFGALIAATGLLGVLVYWYMS